MPSLKDIRRRITSVKNTQKITRAMKLVSAAKFAPGQYRRRGFAPLRPGFRRDGRRLVKAAGDDVESPLLSRSAREEDVWSS